MFSIEEARKQGKQIISTSTGQVVKHWHYFDELKLLVYLTPGYVGNRIISTPLSFIGKSLKVVDEPVEKFNVVVDANCFSYDNETMALKHFNEYSKRYACILIKYSFATSETDTVPQKIEILRTNTPVSLNDVGIVGNEGYVEPTDHENGEEIDDELDDEEPRPPKYYPAKKR